MITTQVDIQIDASLLRDARALDRAVQRFFRKARIILSQDQAERFETSTAPDGTPWQPLSEGTLYRSIQQALRKIGVQGRYTIRRQQGSLSLVYQGGEVVARIRRARSGALTAYATRRVAGAQRSARVRRTRQSKILVDTGRLRNSVVALAASADAVRQQQQTTLTWGTRVPYAAAHQYGVPERNLPARPFLGVSDHARTRLEQAMQEVLNET